MLAQSLEIDKPSLKVKEREARASTFKNGKNGRLSPELIPLETFGFRDILG